MSSARVVRLCAALSSAAMAAAVLASTSIAQAQTATTVIALPFDGSATDELLDGAHDAARASLIARGYTAPERSAVRNAMAVAAPRDTAQIIAFGRSMSGNFVLKGTITPLTGQYNLDLFLYEVSTSRVAEVRRNVGLAEQETVIAEMIAALFAPGALQESPEVRAQREAEAARLAAEQRAADEARRRREEEQRRTEENARQQEAARRAALEAQRLNGNRFAAGGVISASLAARFGTRLGATETRPMGAPPTTSFAFAIRADGLYAVAPSIGLELGGAISLITTPQVAITVGPAARFSYPWRSSIPLRASLGMAVGLFAATTGNRAVSVWLSPDLRAEYDIAPQFSVYAGVGLDFAPGALTLFNGTVGVRLHFGEPSPVPAAAAATDATPQPAATAQR